MSFPFALLLGREALSEEQIPTITLNSRAQFTNHLCSGLLKENMLCPGKCNPSSTTVDSVLAMGEATECALASLLPYRPHVVSFLVRALSSRTLGQVGQCPEGDCDPSSGRSWECCSCCIVLWLQPAKLEECQGLGLPPDFGGVGPVEPSSPQREWGQQGCARQFRRKN